MVDMRRADLDAAKQKLLSEKSNNSKLLITLQSIEQTVADLALRHREEADKLDGEVVHVSEELKSKENIFGLWMNSRRMLIDHPVIMLS